jgi:CBS domain-containing protein
MSFIIFGPGISDHLTLNQALSPSAMPSLPQAVVPVNVTRRVQGTDDDPTGREAWRDELAAGPAPRTPAIGAYESVRHAQRELGPVQFAEQIMTSPVLSLVPDARISEFRELCIRRKIGLVPLIDAQKRLVGIVTKGDLSRQRVRYTDLAPRAVYTIASPSVLTATTNTNIRELARVLLAQDIRGIPIVNDVGEVVGVVTRGDILRALVNYAPLELWL